MSAILERATRAPALAPVQSVDPAFARDVLAGLSMQHKSIPSTWLYDHRGSQLFEQITELPEYYPTRTETWILERCAAQIAAEAGPEAVVVELGSGSSRKTPLLLAALERPSAYVPIDISAQFLDESVQALGRRFPTLPMAPLVADFTRLQTLPELAFGAAGGRRLVFFPGSTIGNFVPEAAVGLLERIGGAVGRGALLVVGADATQDPGVLVPAYDDAQGVTAAFNKNLLTRINRELDADFSATAFRHEARWDPHHQRVEMHLVSEYTQRVTVLGHAFRFAAGESIHTENSYKYGIVKFQALARRAGWTQRQLWMDAKARFALHVLERVR
ncbi:MAG: L-histidine N(alpha)-methyltransferase [Piscinibacter sp.]|nr:L-histidine N(alpha)-methyltransferase [Piscinibacter sp.]